MKISQMADITKIYSIGIAIVTGLALVGGVVAFMQGVESLASFEVGFVGFNLVVGSSFGALLKRVRAEKATQEAQSNIIESTQEAKDSTSNAEQNSKAQDKVTFSTRFIVGAQMSLSFLRMISYALFAFMIFGLLKYQLMSLPSLSVGLGLAMICFLSFGFYAMVKTSQRTKHFFGKVS